MSDCENSDCESGNESEIEIESGNESGSESGRGSVVENRKIGGADDDAISNDGSISSSDDDEDSVQTGGADDDEDLEDSEDEGFEQSDDEAKNEDEGGRIPTETANKKKQVKIKKTTQLNFNDEDEEEEDEYDENYLQKFDGELNKNYISEFHPECLYHSSDEIAKLAIVVRDEYNIVVDPLHKSLPYLTKYEKARVLGQRAKQIETGAKPFIKVPENIIDGYLIAELELREKKIPFIIKRPIPGGAFEYWNLKDLENINF